MKGERSEVIFHPAIKAELVKRSLAEGRPMNEIIAEAICLLFGWEAANYAPPRKPPGRPAGSRAKKPRKAR